jgi:hypothetical protein
VPNVWTSLFIGFHFILVRVLTLVTQLQELSVWKFTSRNHYFHFQKYFYRNKLKIITWSLRDIIELSRKITVLFFIIIQAQSGYQHLPKLWVDLQVSEFCSLKRGPKFEFVKAFSDTVLQVGFSVCFFPPIKTSIMLILLLQNRWHKLICCTLVLIPGIFVVHI